MSATVVMFQASIEVAFNASLKCKRRTCVLLSPWVVNF